MAEGTGTDLVTVEQSSAVTAAVANPKEALAQVDGQLTYAAGMAKRLVKVMREQGLTQRYGDKEYPLVEAWQLLAAWNQGNPIIRYSRPITNSSGTPVAWECRVEIESADGRVIGAGESMADIGEETTRRDGKIVTRFNVSHEARAMAQTRAISRACANKYRFIMKLAGVETTPAEEVPSGGFADSVSAIKAQQPAAATPVRRGRPPKAQAQPAAPAPTASAPVPAAEPVKPAPVQNATPPPGPEQDDTPEPGPNDFSIGPCRVIGIDVKTAKDYHPDGTPKWTLYVCRCVTADDAAETMDASTFSKTLRGLAQEAVDTGANVTLTLETRGEYKGKPQYNLKGLVLGGPGEGI